MTKVEFIRNIRQLIAKGKTDEALTLMSAEVRNYDPSLVNDATLLESRYTRASNAFKVENVIIRAEFDVTVAQINDGLLEMLEQLEKSVEVKTSAPKNKNSGRILHNIPGTMPIGKESRCIVRIAYDDEILMRDLKADANTVVQSVRIAEVMGVQLVDFNEIPAFGIRTMTEAEQFMSEDDYTQWIFMVKALREGTFPLTLKVAVIEEVNGKERKRDIVLEKEVFIISELQQPAAAAATPPTTRGMSPQPSATHFEDTSIHFNYVLQDDSGMATVTQSKRFSTSGILSTIGVIVLALTGWVAFQKFSAPKPPTEIVLKDGQQNGSNNNKIPDANRIDTTLQLKETPIFRDTPQSQVAENPTIKDMKKQSEVATNTPKTDTKTQGEIASNTSKGETQNPSSSNGKTPQINGSGGKETKTDKNKGQIVVKTNTKPRTTKPPIGKPTKPQVYATKSEKVVYPPKAEQQQPKIKIGEIKLGQDTGNLIGSKSSAPTEVKTYRVKLILKGEMKKAEISVDGQSVDQFLKKNIWGTPQYIEFKSSTERHTITFKRGNVSCSVKDIVIENGNMTVEPCSFE